ncbi:hypothetical protein BH23ACT2_BH23ACT2_22740 [soil metagenome]
MSLEDPWVYRPPVEATVTDPFRPPPEPWLAGNRGIKFATEPGTVARAIGPGVVTFAGPVAGTLHVTVRHPDGLRSSYSFVAAVRVQLGQRVEGGEVVAVAGAGLHLGVRRGDAYIDPASLWGRRAGAGHVVLVPLDPQGAPAAGEPSRPDAEPGSGWAGVGTTMGGYGRAAGHALNGAVTAATSAVGDVVG